MPHFIIRAKIHTEDPAAIRPVLRRLFPDSSVTLTGDPKELVLQAEQEGDSAPELNRSLLTELRRVERRTRLRAEWTAEGRTEKFFDYVPKAVRGGPEAVH
ncbi:MAG: hypothetical protein WAN40_08665 [Thermoplasmata archaeon]